MAGYLQTLQISAKKKNLKTIIETGQGLLVNNTVKVNLTSSVGDTAQQQHFTSYHIP